MKYQTSCRDFTPTPQHQQYYLEKLEMRGLRFTEAVRGKVSFGCGLQLVYIMHGIGFDTEDSWSIRTRESQSEVSHLARKGKATWTWHSAVVYACIVELSSDKILSWSVC